MMAVLVAAYALTAVAAPFAHALELDHDGPGDGHGASALALAASSAPTLPAPVPPGGHDPLHDEADCLACAFLALSGAPAPEDAVRETPEVRVALLPSAVFLPSGAALAAPNSRGPPAA
jgi:hypothetical protein